MKERLSTLAGYCDWRQHISSTEVVLVGVAWLTVDFDIRVIGQFDSAK